MKKIYKQSSLGLTFLVLFWLCGASTLMAQTTFSATGVPVAIPDASDVRRTVTVSGLNGTVANANEVQVNFAIAHSWAGDIKVGIIPPGGSEIIIVNSINVNCSSNANKSDFYSSNTISIRQNAAGTIPNTNDIVIPAGIYLPSGCPPLGSLASLVGATRDGDWTIKVYDVESIITGTLHLASISFFGVEACTPPSLSISQSATAICEGQTLNLSTTDGLSSYSWASSSGTFSSSTATATFSSSSAGGFRFSVTATSTGTCTASATASVTINANPSVSISPATSSICVGKTLNLTASLPPPSAGLEPAPPPAPSYGYAWASSGGSFESSTGSPVSWSSESSGDFIFTVTATNTNSCSATATTSVSVNANPVAAAGKTSAETICVGGSIALTSSGGSTYSWAGPTGSSFSSTSQNPSSFTATSTSFGGVYSLTVSATTGCTATASTSISVIALPISYTVTGGGSYCQGGTGVAIGLSNSEIGVTYQLKNGASAVGSPVSGTGSSISFGLQTALVTYTVVATRTNGGCTADMSGSASVSITYPFSALASSVSCSGGSLQLSTTFYPLGASKWQGPSGFSSNLSKPTVNNMSQAKAGVYTVSVTYNNCISMATVSVSVPSPQTASVSSNSPVCIGSSIKLTANTVGVSYQWKGPKSFSSSLKTPTVSATNTAQQGLYSLTVTGSTGCYSTATVSVVVHACGATRIASGEEVDGMKIEVNTYPNPTSKLLTVEVSLKEPSSLKLNLYNATGNVLNEWQLNEESTTHRKEIDLSVYKDGLYLIQAQSKDGKQSKRVVKVE